MKFKKNISILLCIDLLLTSVRLSFALGEDNNSNNAETINMDVNNMRRLESLKKLSIFLVILFSVTYILFGCSVNKTSTESEQKVTESKINANKSDATKWSMNTLIILIL